MKSLLGNGKGVISFSVILLTTGLAGQAFDTFIDDRQRVAVVSKVNGEVTILEDSTFEFRKVQSGQSVFAGSTLRTRSDGGAIVTLQSGESIVVAQNSEIFFENSLLETGVEHVSLDLARGEFRVIDQPRLENGIEKALTTLREPRRRVSLTVRGVTLLDRESSAGLLQENRRSEIGLRVRPVESVAPSPDGQGSPNFSLVEVYGNLGDFQATNKVAREILGIEPLRPDVSADGSGSVATRQFALAPGRGLVPAKAAKAAPKDSKDTLLSFPRINVPESAFLDEEQAFAKSERLEVKRTLNAKWQSGPSLQLMPAEKSSLNELQRNLTDLRKQKRPLVKLPTEDYLLTSGFDNYKGQEFIFPFRGDRVPEKISLTSAQKELAAAPMPQASFWGVTVPSSVIFNQGGNSVGPGTAKTLEFLMKKEGQTFLAPVSVVDPWKLKTPVVLRLRRARGEADVPNLLRITSEAPQPSDVVLRVEDRQALTSLRLILEKYTEVQISEGGTITGDRLFFTRGGKTLLEVSADSLSWEEGQLLQKSTGATAIFSGSSAPPQFQVGRMNPADIQRMRESPLPSVYAECRDKFMRLDKSYFMGLEALDSMLEGSGCSVIYLSPPQGMTGLSR